MQMFKTAGENPDHSAKLRKDALTRLLWRRVIDGLCTLGSSKSKSEFVCLCVRFFPCVFLPLVTINRQGFGVKEIKIQYIHQIMKQ